MSDTEIMENTVAAKKDTVALRISTTTTSTAAAASSMPASLVVAHLFSFSLSYIIINSFWEFEDASNALAFYGVYHRYGWNQVVHFFGVPGIIWSILIFLVHVPLPLFASTKDGSSSSLNYGSFLAICYSLFYLSIDPLGATLYAPILYAMYASATDIMQKDQRKAREAAARATNKPSLMLPWYGTGKALKIALAVHVLCWYLQVHLGHKIIEGAQPAVLESLGGALTVAPLFAFYEGLWLMGINQQLQKTTLLLVENYTRTICSEGGVTAMKACQSLLIQQ
mmetsp:Transcript_27515/g.60543  ORF Transcript_27515/g.60543 Transcript_27515/m.60543 type:complete len:282 (-) Transcript_27515:161-1006(-)|eukprot:CAMPEP_0168184470 /NCGR_PEP_ID=MMETSP0139_2-20121125/13256_1 /TAXON_ID=44445 /ORGANISM="Pseudo-nitzschia australis, Strain 10249 10 AB" /LENGTH=281 /DNA_ID=CAMNT_0008106093 /DNA_START=121 /DNA_END=966 /DNA_ORIENTATION=-